MPNRARATSRSLPKGLAGGCEGYGPKFAVRYIATASRLVRSAVCSGFCVLLKHFSLKDVYVYTTRDFEEATNAYEKVIKELNIELELLRYQLESSKSEKLSINLALKNAEDQLDSNYREINQMNDNLEKHRIDLGDMMDKNIQLERRIKERFCCFSFI